MRSGEWSLTDTAEAAELRRVAAERKVKYRQGRRDAKIALHDASAPVNRANDLNVVRNDLQSFILFVLWTAVPRGVGVEMQ